MSEIEAKIKVKCTDPEGLFLYTHPDEDVSNEISQIIIDNYKKISYMAIESKQSDINHRDFYSDEGRVIYTAFNNESVNNYFEILEENV